MLQNLLGHFNRKVDFITTKEYIPGEIDSHDSIFYLGSYYNNPLPKAFIQDISNTEKTVVWFRYNLDQLSSNSKLDLAQKYGFSFQGIRGLNAIPSQNNLAPGFFDTVKYKNKSLIKEYSYDVKTNNVEADTDIGIISIDDSRKVQTFAQIKNSVTSEEVPYAIRSQNFWYIADIPFTHIGARDRYLVFCDLLHDILDTHQKEQHRAMVRLEDVSAVSNPQNIRTITDYLHSKKIPFAIAVIPNFRDPLNIGNYGISRNIPISENRELVKALKYATKHGGSIVMHGYTHQYESMPNPLGVSAFDFEFWNMAENRPVDLDSREWVIKRLAHGIRMLRRAGLKSFAWEVPHYQASPTDYRSFAEMFKTTYQRVVYYTSEYPNLNPQDPERDLSLSQFFPYIISQDYYGQKVLPENIGNLKYKGDPYISQKTMFKEDLILNAENALIIRDGFASFFFHPYLLNEELGVPGFDDFKRVIEGISQLGYTWADPSSL